MESDEGKRGRHTLPQKVFININITQLKTKHVNYNCKKNNRACVQFNILHACEYFKMRQRKSQMLRNIYLHLWRNINYGTEVTQFFKRNT